MVLHRARRPVPLVRRAQVAQLPQVRQLPLVGCAQFAQVAQLRHASTHVARDPQVAREVAQQRPMPPRPMAEVGQSAASRARRTAQPELRTAVVVGIAVHRTAMYHTAVHRTAHRRVVVGGAVVLLRTALLVVVVRSAVVVVRIALLGGTGRHREGGPVHESAHSKRPTENVNGEAGGLNTSETRDMSRHGTRTPTKAFSSFTILSFAEKRRSMRPSSSRARAGDGERARLRQYIRSRDRLRDRDRLRGSSCDRS